MVATSTTEIAGAPDRSALLRWVFTLTILTGSFLLFLIQPMFARMVLPRLGGAPSVWNVAMVFYQTLLLAGYLYAHLLIRLPMRAQITVHAVLFGCAALTLPVGVAVAFSDAGGTSPTLWLLGLLAFSIGPIFFVVSSQAPLMQAWFARSDHPLRENPYFLYAASNIGSLIALLSYPFLFEPGLTLANQSLIWSLGFAGLALLTVACGLIVLKGRTQGAAALAEQAPAEPCSWRQRLSWTVLSAVPSALLVSTTAYLTTDLMAMPLLWVIPLALYLLSFVFVFEDRFAGATAHAQRIAPFLIVFMAWSVFTPFRSTPWVPLVASLLGLFYIALALHGRLSNSRPASSQLTEFYLWMSVGGMLGGVFSALLAPVIFNWTYEHLILLVAAAWLVRGQQVLPGISGIPKRGLIYVLGAILLLALLASNLLDGGTGNLVATLLMVLAAILAIGEPLLFGVFVALILLYGGALSVISSSVNDFRTRSFFGTYAVHDNTGTKAREFSHGTTLHGVQSLDPEKRLVPSTYYGKGSGVGEVLTAAPGLFGKDASIGAIGLGVGTLACYKKPGQDWLFIEIDPAVVEIAKDPGHFTYLRDCAPDARIEVGDGRLALDDVADGSLDLLVVDAFSSDAIPLHLMTVEAFETYGRTLDEHGAILVHVTNRYLELEPVVSRIVARLGWQATIRFDEEESEGDNFHTRSKWILVMRDKADIARVTGATRVAWRPLATDPETHAWTDDWANVIRAMKF
ncbi:MAG: fused MFS/spermidine synthase [Sphingomonadaceae bacterium]